MTATEELRRLLDERGVKWRDDSSIYGTRRTVWTADGVTYIAAEVGGRLKVSGYLTPAQAVEAALGRGKCRNASYRLDESRFHCSDCWFGCWVKDVADGRDKLPRYCPNCGREVEK